MSETTRHPLARAVLTGALVSVFGLGLGITPVHADKLDDKKDQIEQQIQGSEEDLEDLNSTLAAAAKKLKEYQDKLPAAQQRLAAAEAAVTTARSKVEALQARLSEAQASRTELSEARAKRAQRGTDAQAMVGQIAANAYRTGGASSVSGNLDVLFSGEDPQVVAGSLEIASRVMQAQNKTIGTLREQQAQDANDAARLKAVEEQIADLKSQAEQALAQQKSARDTAQAAKDEVDKILADTASAQATLKDQIADVQGKLEQQKKDQADVNAQIKERQERLKREAEERAKKAAAEAAAKRKAAQAAAKKKAANAAKLAAEADAAEANASAAKDDATPSGSYNESSWGLIVPADPAGYITSGYGWRPTPAGTIDYGGAGGYVHAGLDWGFGGRCGLPIKAAAAGTVEWAGWKGTHGQIVSIDHKITKGHALTTNYNHMSRVAVRVGQKVKQGQVIGYVGTTGNSTGCHLHFETVVDGSTVNPARLLP
ncbi:peptidoglycan DD-metalloendopeptidase family protein [Galactobacter valiniphilus]|uniref:peptidoglycan DD-metalloendopeptidase family protein n=1 Tax=Galactobacter valiniphilus TaxID=2676122 RepID=UPI00373698BA